MSAPGRKRAFANLHISSRKLSVIAEKSGSIPRVRTACPVRFWTRQRSPRSVGEPKPRYGRVSGPRTQISWRVVVEIDLKDRQRVQSQPLGSLNATDKH